MPASAFKYSGSVATRGLAFSGGHFGDLALVEHHPADELHVVGNHVPYQLVSGDLDRSPEQPAAGFPYGRECLRQKLVQTSGYFLLVLPLQLMKAALELVPFDRIGAAMLGFSHLVELSLERAGALVQPLAKAGGLSLQVGFTEVLEPFFLGVDLIHDGLDALPLPVESRTEDRGHERLDHSASKYNWCRAMYSATASGTQ